MNYNTYAPAPVQQTQGYAPAPVQQTQGYAPQPVPQTQGYAPAPVQQVQGYAPQPVPQVQAQVPKPLTETQIVFTIINSEVAKFKRLGHSIDPKATRETYQKHYTGWTQQQLMQAALSLVEIYDQYAKVWRLAQNEQEVRSKQQQFSKRYNYFKNRRAA